MKNTSHSTYFTLCIFTHSGYISNISESAPTAKRGTGRESSKEIKVKSK